jgi:hypothetical protein
MKDATPKDKIKDRYENSKSYAIKFGKSWAESLAEAYVEPSRAGTPKGESIGLSRNKFRTALLMVLYGVLGLNLKEIAQIAGVSSGLIRLWRTESVFKKAVQLASDRFAEQFANTIDLLVFKAYKKIGWKDKEEIFEDELLRSPRFKFIKSLSYGDRKDPINTLLPLCDILPFFNPAIFPVIFKRFKKRIDAGSTYHIYIVLRIMERSVAKDKKKLRRWTIANLDTMKMEVALTLDLLIEPKILKSSEREPTESRKKLMLSLRDSIFHTFEILAW